jgi:hypothetical protein
MDLSQSYRRLDHGYDESKQTLEITDLRHAAQFRGGLLVSDRWNGKMDEKLKWKCCREHRFELSPGSVLLGGHWCRECIDPPWVYEEIANENRFAAQVVNVNGESSSQLAGSHPTQE